MADECEQCGRELSASDAMVGARICGRCAADPNTRIAGPRGDSIGASSTLKLDFPLDATWHFLSDFEAWPTWWKRCKEIEVPSIVEEGATLTMRHAPVVKAYYQIASMKQPTELVLRNQISGCVVVLLGIPNVQQTWRLEGDSTTTTVTYGLRYWASNPLQWGQTLVQSLALRLSNQTNAILEDLEAGMRSAQEEPSLD